MSDFNELLDAQQSKNEEEMGADKWQPEAGDSLSGGILKTGWFEGGDYEPSMFLLFKDYETGDTYRIYMPTVLKKQIVELAPAIGQHIAIRYEGKQEGASGRSYHNWTTVPIPDKDGKVKQDHAYWRKAVTYVPQPTNAVGHPVDTDPGDFF